MGKIVSSSSKSNDSKLKLGIEVLADNESMNDSILPKKGKTVESESDDEDILVKKTGQQHHDNLEDEDFEVIFVFSYYDCFRSKNEVHSINSIVYCLYSWMYRRK